MPANAAKATEQRDAVVQKYGPWTAHNIFLGADTYTIAPRVVGDEVRARRITQVVLDLMGGSVEGKRVLDLACAEGLFAIELAMHGANCLGIEGREASIEKARFVKKVLGLENLDLVQDDVRNLSVEKYGKFDVVLCIGILYHLDVPDVFQFLERVCESATRLCIVDTRVITKPKTKVQYRGHVYAGTRGEEHDPRDPAEKRLSRLWASLDNPTNFWLSRASVCNAMARGGCTSIYECNLPSEPWRPGNRLCFIGIKGQPVRILSNPLTQGRPLDDMPERPPRENSVPVEVVRRMSHLLPRRLRAVGKRLVGRENKLT